MKFHFVQKQDENMASYRYRVKAPIQYLKSIGWEQCKDWPLADVIIISKHFSASRDWSLAQDARRRGIKVVFDICDWHMGNTKVGAHYRRMIAYADGVTVPNESWLSAGLHKTTVHVIGDGYLWDEKEPKCEANSPLRILWYGSLANYQLLQKMVKPVPDSVVEIVTGRGEHPFKVYSSEVMKDAYEWCDLVIVPAESALKSPNRQIEAIRQGRFVVSSDLPQHRPTGTYCGDINEGIEWYRNNLPEALTRLKAAQNAVKKLYGPETIGKQWEAALTAICAKKRKRAA